MFTQWHYVPVLRAKQGEWGALRGLPLSIRKRMTPLIELPRQMVMEPSKRYHDSREVVERLAEQIASARGNLPAFVDLCLLGDDDRIDGKQPWHVFGQALRIWPIAGIPVAHLGKSSDHYRALSSVAEMFDDKSIGVRIRALDYRRADLQDAVGALLKALGARAEGVHLLVDLQHLYNTMRDYTKLLDVFKPLEVWGTLTVLAGSFPADLQEFQRGTTAKWPRHDWLSWVQNVTANELHRKPAFGDYTTQHAIYFEPLSECNPSASVRYTLPESWMIMRGEGLRNKGGPGSDQWIGHAMLLCEYEEYYGPSFSAGDAYIWERANNTDKTGTPSKWLQAGINHHLTLTVKQIGQTCAGAAGPKPSGAESRNRALRRAGRKPQNDVLI